MTMRPNRIYIIIMAGLLISLCNSCKDTGPINYQNSVITLKPQNLSLSTKDVFFNTPQASTSHFQVNSTNIEWEITDIPDWISVSPISGYDNTTVTVTVSENTLTSNRVGILSFRSADDSWSYSSPLTVSQIRAKYYATPDTNRIEFSGATSSATIKITSNTDDWNINTNPAMDWCTVSKEDDCINISVTANAGKTSRSTVIEILTTDVTEYVTIFQHPAKISSISDQLNFSGEGGTIPIEIESDVPWTISTNCKWINVSPTSGPAGKSTISVTAMANGSFDHRVDYIYIVFSDDNKITIRITQEELLFDFDIDNTEIDSPSSGGEYSANIESSRPWSVIDCPSWIHVTPSSGTGNATMKITVDPNNEPSERYGCVTVSPDNIDYPFYIDIWQAAVISSDNGSMHFSDKAGYSYLSIYTDFNWTALTSDNWITLDTESGYGNAQLKVSVTENSTDTIRKGLIIISAENAQMKVLVEQQGKYLNILSGALNFSSKGGSTQVTLNSNDSWTATVSNDWISLSTNEGNGNGNLTITTVNNPSSNARSGYVDVVPVAAKPIRITVNQAARYLKVSPATIYLNGKGGYPVPITISTDGTAKVTTQNRWLSINKESDNRFTITATANGNPVRTGTVTISLTDLTDGALSTSVTVIQDNMNEPYHNGHECVDLGLSVRWATCNVGANKPENYGSYYGWGEYESKSRYTWTEYRFCVGENPVRLSKYNTASMRGAIDNKTTLEPSDDAAQVKWGGGWRTPTYAEYQELISECTWTWTQQNGVNGYKINSNKPGFTQNYIFMPAAGMYYDKDLNDPGSIGAYWSSSLDSSNPTSAWEFNFDDMSYSTGTKYGRDCGRSVRPVCP